jgi:hypothetical protein
MQRASDHVRSSSPVGQPRIAWIQHHGIAAQSGRRAAVERFSDRGTPGIAPERMMENLRATAKVAEDELSVEVTRLSDKATLGAACERMTTQPYSNIRKQMSCA